MQDIDHADYPFSLRVTATAGEVAETVREFGLAHIESQIGDDVVERLATEAYALFDDNEPWIAHEPYGLGRSVRLVRRDVDRDSCPTLLETFACRYLEEITAAYYGDGYLFAEHIWVMVDEVASTTIVQQLHYDKLAHLKHFYYLSDVGSESGPFHCVPGSQFIPKQIQARNRRQGVIATDEEARVFPPGIAEREIPVLGRRGTLIVFDTDVAHRASVPTVGNRLAARSLSYGPQSIGRALYSDD